jgi:hypothetical protein
MNAQMLKMLMGMLKPMLPILSNKPIEEQSQMAHDAERWLTRWFERKREVTPLEEGENDLALMFKIMDGQLVMLPVTITEVDNKEYINRGFINQGINVTEMAKKLPLYTLLPLLLEGDTSPSAKLRLQQIFIATIREAAHHPDARLDEIEDASYAIDVPFRSLKEIKHSELVEVDALGEVLEEEMEFTAILVNTRYGERYEMMPQDEWEGLEESQKRQLLFEAGIAMDQLVTEQQF